MAFEDYDVEFGYSISDMARGSRKAYEISDYEVESIEAIERLADQDGYSERSECLEHLHFVERLYKHLSVISLAEEREGIMNWELRGFLKRLEGLSFRLSRRADALPEVVVYR